MGVYRRQTTRCQKRWDDLRCWARKTEEAQLGMASQRERGAHWTLTTLVVKILTVAYPELDGHLRESQQPQGGQFPVCEGAVYANGGVGAVIDPVYPLSLSPLSCFVILSLCALASSGGGAGEPMTEKAASHMTLEAGSTDATSRTEGKGRTTAETGGDNTDSDTTSDGSSRVVADTSVTTPAAGTVATLYQ
ncbi:hypothetical protein NDU88_005980 [Pleurodeles waltl]|uniref:Uncharacterized protein n=1 Tax=Pleurodeles waltl TaxID=8319 RepID=A0AAV7MAY2_PLEWA|nr:hypothetical protein NDU88_005980 [Pleurodeles waltl]